MSHWSGWSAGAILILAGPAPAEAASAPPPEPTSSIAPAATIAGPIDASPPRNARAGQCFVKVLEPEVRRRETVRVLVSPARRTLTARPGVCRSEDRLEIVRPPSTVTTVIPAVTRRVVETRVVKPAQTHEEALPAVYQDIVSQVEVRPARLEWRLVEAGADNGTPPYAGGPVREAVGGGRLCLIQTPPLYQTVLRRVMTEPQRIVEVETPAETVQVVREEVVRPERRETRADPGETRRTPVKICQPDETVTTQEPAVYRSQQEDRLVSPARYRWRPIACAAAHAPPPKPRPCRCGHAVSTQAAPPLSGRAAPASTLEFHPQGDGAVARLQGQLATRGYYQGPVDGLFTPQTMTAMTRFQRDHHLAEGRYTQQTASALGPGG